MTTTENDLTTTPDYALAIRYNDAIDLAYVHARRAVKRLRQEMDTLQGRTPSREQDLVTLGMGAIAAVELRVRYNRPRRRMTDTERAVAWRNHPQTIAMLGEPNEKRRERVETTRQAEGQVDEFHDAIRREQAEEKALLRGER